MYVLPRIPCLHNPTPEYKVRNGALRDSGWWTTDGYLYEADQEARCVLENRKLLLEQGKDYRQFAVIRIDVEQTPNDVTKTWNKIRRKLRQRGFDLLWVREINPSNNRIHYNCLTTSHQDLAAAFNQALPPGIPRLPGWCDVRPFKPHLAYLCARYIVKAKTARYGPDGHLVSRDRWQAKRHLFIKDVGFDKCGSFGGFWQKLKEQLWKDIKNTEKRIAEGMLLNGVDQLVDYLADLTQGYFSKKDLQRRVGYFAKEYEAANTLLPPPPYVFVSRPAINPTQSRRAMTPRAIQPRTFSRLNVMTRNLQRHQVGLITILKGESTAEKRWPGKAIARPRNRSP